MRTRQNTNTHENYSLLLGYLTKKIHPKKPSVIDRSKVAGELGVPRWLVDKSILCLLNQKFIFHAADKRASVYVKDASMDILSPEGLKSWVDNYISDKLNISKIRQQEAALKVAPVLEFEQPPIEQPAPTPADNRYGYYVSGLGLKLFATQDEACADAYDHVTQTGVLCVEILHIVGQVINRPTVTIF